MPSLLSFLIFVCPPPHLHHLPTPSDLVRLPSATSTPGVLVQLCYVHTWTSLRLTLDLLGPYPHAKGYHLYTSYNLSDPFFIINNRELPSCLTPFSALPIHYIEPDLSRMRRQLSSHFYSGKVPLCIYFDLCIITLLLRHSPGTHSPSVTPCIYFRPPPVPRLLLYSRPSI